MDDFDLDSELNGEFSIPTTSTSSLIKSYASNTEEENRSYLQSIHNKIHDLEMKILAKKLKSYDLIKAEEESRRFHNEKLKQEVIDTNECIEYLKNASSESTNDFIKKYTESYLKNYKVAYSSATHFPWSSFDDSIQTTCLKLLQQHKVIESQSYLLGYLECISQVPIINQSAHGKLFSSRIQSISGRHPFCSYIQVMILSIKALLERVRLEMNSGSYLCDQLKYIVTCSTIVWLQSWNKFNTDILRQQLQEILQECCQHIIFISIPTLCHVFLSFEYQAIMRDKLALEAVQSPHRTSWVKLLRSTTTTDVNNSNNNSNSNSNNTLTTTTANNMGTSSSSSSLLTHDSTTALPPAYDEIYHYTQHAAMIHANLISTADTSSLSNTITSLPNSDHTAVTPIPLDLALADLSIELDQLSEADIEIIPSPVNSMIPQVDAIITPLTSPYQPTTSPYQPTTTTTNMNTTNTNASINDRFSIPHSHQIRQDWTLSSSTTTPTLKTIEHFELLSSPVATSSSSANNTHSLQVTTPVNMIHTQSLHMDPNRLYTLLELYELCKIPFEYRSDKLLQLQDLFIDYQVLETVKTPTEVCSVTLSVIDKITSIYHTKMMSTNTDMKNNPITSTTTTTTTTTTTPTTTTSPNSSHHSVNRHDIHIHDTILIALIQLSMSMYFQAVKLTQQTYTHTQSQDQKTVPTGEKNSSIKTTSTATTTIQRHKAQYEKSSRMKMASLLKLAETFILPHWKRRREGYTLEMCYTAIITLPENI